MSELPVTGPSGETEYYLYRPRITEHEYQDVACSLTRQVLALSPRRVNAVRIQGTVSLLQLGGAEESALEILREAGFTITDGHINGQVAAYPDVVDSVLSAYTRGAGSVPEGRRSAHEASGNSKRTPWSVSTAADGNADGSCAVSRFITVVFASSGQSTLTFR